MLNIRPATVDDAALLRSLIWELADFEKESDEVRVTAEDLARDGFGASPKFRALIAEWEGQPAGYALFFGYYSTWRGAGIYLEDLYVRPTARGHGLGRRLVADLAALAVREGFRSIEHIKRYTTTGMATDQGKTSNMAAIGLVSEILKKPIPEVGTTTFRPPYTPVTFGAIVGSARGELFDPIRQTPLHDWAQAHGAVFENVALWRRARYFPKDGENMHQAVSRECRTVRASVGLFDASTLGKIEVAGPDAAEFLNRIYINGWLGLEPGRCRYGVMLREDGFVFDDGVVARLTPELFHVTTTTGGASRVLAHMEDYLQTEWPDLKVFLTSVTEQWAVIAVQGPKAREILTPFVADIDLSAEAFPHMAVRTGHICGVPTRLFR